GITGGGALLWLLGHFAEKGGQEALEEDDE
ncbi:TPA: cell division protein, partial [Enterococcus faecium]|nr:cell division protein [Enterococcus faecium]